MAEETETEVAEEIVIETPEEKEETPKEEKVEASKEEKVEVQSEDKPEQPTQEDELDSYSKGVQNRIKKLTEKYRQEERDKAEALRVSQELLVDKN